MKNLFSNDNSGYRLKTLQILNWGVFDKKVITFSFDGKSTILTGLNGSGKTTTVDAILTLLIPSDKRYYNLSSENSKKRERDERNYVLGAYGFRQEEDTRAAQYLRQKNEVVSILNGIFYEPNDSKYLSLLQVRYFSGEDLKCLKIITEKELEIEDITQLLAENGSQISQSTRWVQFLTKAYGSKSYESFEQYKNFFMDRFGFRSDNALKLFSQTVGLKVLGDITSFIKGYMLEDKSPIAEYEKINSVFSDLMVIERNMRKTEKQIEFLSKTVDFGERFTIANDEFNTIKDSLFGLECWFISHAFSLGEEEVEKRELEINELTTEIERNKTELYQLEELLFSLKSDNMLKAFNDLERDIKDAEINEKNKREKRNSYAGLVSNLINQGFGLVAVDFPSVNSKEGFQLNRKRLPEIKKIAEAEKERIDAKIIEKGVETKNLQAKISKVEEEIQSLEGRENNIPSSLVSLREQIAQNTKINTSSIPFVGELVKVKDSEKDWKKAIENLLSAYALMLIAETCNYEKIIRFLNKNDLNDKIGVIKHENIIKQRLSSQILVKIEIKNCSLSSWLQDYLENEIPHVFVLTEEELLNTEFAVLPSGVIKTCEKIIKDDRVDPLTGNFPLLLGWTNKERIEELYRLGSVFNSKLETLKEEKTTFASRKESLQRSLNLIERLSEFELFDEIDVESAFELLMKKRKEKQEILDSNVNLHEIQAKIEATKRKKDIISQKNERLLEEIGAQKQKLSIIKKQVEIYGEKEELRYRAEEISAFESSFGKELTYSDLDSLKVLYDKLQTGLRDQCGEKEKVVSSIKLRLLASMNNFLAPTRFVDADIDWTNEYPQLVIDVNYYSDYKELYTKLKDDSIVELREKFSEYLEDSLSKVVGTLSEELRVWDNEINDAIVILNKNLRCIPFNKELGSYLRVGLRNAGNKDYQMFFDSLRNAIPDRFVLVKGNDNQRKNFYLQIKKFLDKYNNDERLKKRVLDLRNKYSFVIYEDNNDGNQHTYSDTGALSGGEKAKLTYTILAAALCYQYGLDNEDEKQKGPFRFVILDEAFSKSDAFNSQYALELFKELDLQLMVVTPRNGINLVESYVSTLHLIEKRSDNTSTVSSMTIEEYKKAE